jgi:hypothetical protein
VIESKRVAEKGAIKSPLSAIAKILSKYAAV